MKKQYIKISIGSLIVLWVYTTGSKLLEFNTFRHELYMQHFPWHIENVLMILLPLSEFIAAYLLARKDTQNKGLWLSLFLLSVFTLYITLILLGVFTQAPCSCGGVLRILTWKTHLIFNLTFLSLNGWVLYELNQQRKEELKTNDKPTFKMV